ncbi:MAG: hypothetical protein ABIA76_05205 [Candidatus Diapherotrites archaeon]
MNSTITVIGLFLCVIFLIYDWILPAVLVFIFLIFHAISSIGKTKSKFGPALREEIEREKKAISNAQPKSIVPAMKEFGSNLAEDTGNILYERKAEPEIKPAIHDLPGTIGEACENFLNGLSSLFGKKIP